MAEEQSGERSFDPTPKRLREAEKEGDFLQSKELAVALVSASGLIGLTVIGSWIFGELLAMVQTGLTLDAKDIRDFDPGLATEKLVVSIALPLAILIGIVTAATILPSAVLGSMHFRASLAQPKWSRVNPIAGLKRMFGLQGLIELGKSLAKALFIGIVGIGVFYSQWRMLGNDQGIDPQAQLAMLGTGMTLTLIAMAAALIAIALIDIPIEFFRRKGRLMMTRQQLMDEYKQTEGSPELRAAVRRKQYETLSGSMRKAIDSATMVITNPDHFAVALRYNQGVDFAPVIVAKTRGAAAQAVKDYAKEQAVPIVSHPVLARAIYFTGRNGQVIREDLFATVAVVLAFVLNVERRHDLANVANVAAVPEGARFDADGRPMA